MSIASVSNGNVTQPTTAQYYQDQLDKIKTGFQQLGADLQAGNLSQAQTDYASLSQQISSSQTQTNKTINQDFSALGQAIESGSITDAQNAYTTLLQDLQQASSHTHRHHHHHHASSAQQSNPIAQAFDALGKALESGDLSAAQQAYSTIVQNLQQYGLSASAVSSNSSSAGANLTVTA
jgi:soluble cytochrome b562